MGVKNRTREVVLGDEVFSTHGKLKAARMKSGKGKFSHCFFSQALGVGYFFSCKVISVFPAISLKIN
jgi:hypothetical protein